MKNEEGALMCMVEDFRHLLILYKNMSSFYGAGVGYSEGVSDAVANICALYEILFKQVLKEKER